MWGGGRQRPHKLVLKLHWHSLTSQTGGILRFYSYVWWPLYQIGIPDFDAMGFQGCPKRHLAPKQIHIRSIYIYAKKYTNGIKICICSDVLYGIPNAHCDGTWRWSLWG